MNFFYSDPHFGHYNVIKYSNRPYLYSVKGSDIYLDEKLVKSCSDSKEAEKLAQDLSVKLMDDSLVRNWNAKIKPNDTCYLIGDFSLSSSVSYLNGILSRLNGKIILIAGNHDSVSKLKSAGLTDIHKELSMEIDGNPIYLNHYPYVDEDLTKIAKRRPNVMILTKKHIPLPELPPSAEENRFYYSDAKEFLLKYHDHPICLELDPGLKVHSYFKRAVGKLIGPRKVNDGTILLHGHTHSPVKRRGNMINLSVEAWDYAPASEQEIIELINEYKKENK